MNVVKKMFKWLKAYFLYRSLSWSREPGPVKKKMEPVKNGPALLHCTFNKVNIFNSDLNDLLLPQARRGE